MTTRPSRRFLWSSLSVALAVTAGIALPAARATNTEGGGAGQVFVPIVPCRLLDTRAAEQVGPRSSPLGPGDTYNRRWPERTANCVIPAQAAAVAMNVTTVNGSANSFLTCGRPTRRARWPPTSTGGPTRQRRPTRSTSSSAPTVASTSTTTLDRSTSSPTSWATTPTTTTTTATTRGRGRCGGRRRSRRRATRCTTTPTAR